MTLPDHLRSELVGMVALPFDEVRMLPLEMYRSADVLRAELQSVLTPGWHCLARTADLPNPGDHRVGELPHLHPDGTVGIRQVLVVRGDDLVLRAFDNVCIHRGAPLATGCGNEARFTCPYHAWTFRLDGQLIGAPHLPGIDASEHRLGALALEVWEGFVFVNASPTPAPLAPTLEGLTDVVGRFRMDRYVPVHEQVEEWATNWKLLVENFMDTYHVFKVHRATFGASSTSPLNTTMFPGTDDWAHHVALDPDDMAAPTNTSLEGDWRRSVVLAAVFPTHVMQLQPDYLWYLQISPIGTGRVRIRWSVSVDPDVLAVQADPDEYVDGILRLLHAVNAEDQPVAEAVRGAADGPQFTRGPLSGYEQNVVDFDRHLARRLTR
jgi:phenylpropionate dioxygenase-like ring-hydroxylating dioxygenase large terminal subunit